MTTQRGPHQDGIFAFSDSFVSTWALLCPTQATMAGIPGERSGWDDLSPEGAKRVESFLFEELAKLVSLPSPPDEWGQIGRRVAHEYLAEKISYFKSGDNLCDLNSIESPLQQTRQVFDLMERDTARHWELIRDRLLGLGKVFAGYQKALDQGLARDLKVARRQVQAAIEQCQAHGGKDSSLLELIASFDSKKVGDGVLREGLVAALDQGREAFLSFARYLEETYLPQASPKDPFGEERYLRSARRFLGMKLDPIETYAWGFEEIARIEKRMQEIAEQIKPGATVRQVIEELEASAEERMPDREVFLEVMRQRQERALQDLMGSHFEVPECIRSIGVRLAPEGGALGAYYIPPSEDFSRAGTVYYAPGPDKVYTLYSEITTAYHEGFPGHHLQCGLQVYYSKSLTRLHRLLVCCSGYAEGWALYAEQLMEELGYYEKPSYVLGMLLAKLFRACRIVADIGMHLELGIPETWSFHPGEKWTWDLTVELMEQRAFLEPEFARSEATRYLGWPGQAISYKVGERVILDLREEQKKKLGDAFDLKKFHEAVLSAGSVGLDHLRDIVRGDL